MRTIKPASVGIDTILNYNAAIVDFRVPEKKIILTGQADVKYKTMHLTAEKITVDWDTHLITAEGVPETLYVKSRNPGDSTMTIRWRGLPTLSDAGDVMNGFQMIYNYKTEKGRVIQGRTEFEGGYYSGQNMKKITREIINISNGYFTSCDREESPHYHFQSRRIKVILNDKVIAKPVVMYFGHIPVAALPFAVFPNKKGRHSGITIPTYGESYREGRFLRGLGYYWAPSDYFDTSVKVDYFDRAGWILHGDLDYNIRYLLNGSISGSFTRKNFVSGAQERRWDLYINHNQTIDPTSSFGIRGQFVSDKNYYKDFSSNLDMRLNRNIRSDATFSKNWPERGFSFSANLSQQIDIQSGQVSRTLPQMRFSMNSRPLFGRSRSNSASTNAFKSQSATTEKSWREAIYFSYSSNLNNSTSRGGKYPDGRKYTETTNRYVNHSASLSMNIPDKIFGWLTMGQNFQYDERWYDRYLKNNFDRQLNKVEKDTVQGFATRRTFSYSLNATTKIYGMFAPHIGNVQAIRHVVTPNISFIYQPDFSDPGWGYVDIFIDTTGRRITAPRIIDGVSSGGQKSLSFSLANLFQMKTGDDEKAKKLDLFTLNFNSAYNFKAEKNKLSNLTSSFRASPIRNLNVNMSASHSFYKYDATRGLLNELLVMDSEALKKGEVLRLVNFNLSASLSLQGQRKAAAGDTKAETASQVFIDEATGEPVAEQVYYDRLYRPGGNRFEINDRYSGLDIPWRTSLSFSFTLNKYNPLKPSKNFYLDISNMEVQLTKNWKINYVAHLDLETKRIVSQSITVYRDLHCWEAMLTWRPSGIGGKSYYLRINVKAPQLRDLKYEQRGGRSSALGF
ncbi:MAG: LPS assembly protein LptD [candidate division KSB1 bacterium]|nr:LPS assembly protein LptD [candidate division KSB1 bacterium]